MCGPNGVHSQRPGSVRSHASYVRALTSHGCPTVNLQTGCSASSIHRLARRGGVLLQAAHALIGEEVAQLKRISSC